MKKQTGFTLVELLITITILGILSTVAVTRYSASQRFARANDTVTQVIESIRKTRDLAINSKVQSWDDDGNPATPALIVTPENYKIEISNASNQITTKTSWSYIKDDGSTITTDLTSYTSPADGYTLSVSSQKPTSPSAVLPISFSFSLPFGDTSISDSINSFVEVTLKITQGTFARCFSVNKVSGTISVFSTCP